ncbi:MAG: NYN domain-containing protein, partial [Deltaproteobacteria bacterium]|nr:NYN domain-containing protein [Deltaproteobacteria bacterium]
MPLHVVIDGYNLIGSVAGLRGKLEPLRNRLIRELREYQEKRGHPITVVFDGWRSGWINEVEERLD